MRRVRGAATPTMRRGGPIAVALGLALAVACGTATTVHAAADAGPAVASFQADHWGYFFGDKTSADWDKHLKPVSISFPAPVAQVGTSNSSEYALLTDGTVWAWGQGTFGQLGNGGTANSFDTAVQVQFPPSVRIAYLATDAMPYDTALAVDTHGNVWGWGFNRGGELCLGNKREHLTPVELPLTNVSSLAGADEHAVYDSNGTVYSCGQDTNGVLGNGTTRPSLIPTRVSGLPVGEVVELVSAFENAGALLADGRYYDWGFDRKGQLGNGTIGSPSNVPVLVNMPDFSPVTQVAQGGSAAGNGQTLVQLADGAICAWGDDEYSQLGDGRTGVVRTPERILAPGGLTFATLASGGATSYGITSSGEVYAWGYNAQGEVGNGTKQTAPAPVPVDSGASLISSTAGNVAVAAATSQPG